MAGADKPQRIKSILNYLQQDIPKSGDNEESTEGEEEEEEAPATGPGDINGIPPSDKRKKVTPIR